MNFANNLGFSLYAALFVCYMAATSKEQIEFKGVSSNKKYVIIKY